MYHRYQEEHYAEKDVVDPPGLPPGAKVTNYLC